MMTLMEIIMALLGGENMPAPKANPLSTALPGASLNTLDSMKRIGATKPTFAPDQFLNENNTGVRG
jgi:hypothetical protein